MTIFKLFFFIIFTAQISLVFGKPLTFIDKLDQKQTILGLANHHTWRKLMHYEVDNSSPTGIRSAIHSNLFFISPAGKINSEKELSATIRALFSPVNENPNKHIQCMFRGRYFWLKRTLSITDTQLPPINCPDFNSWSLNSETESISVILATGYLGNPASYYGHTLLKLNSSETKLTTNLLDVTVNYGARVPANEDPVSYIIKGLTGNYKGSFSHIKYHFHNHNYGENELRDLWEYELSLTPDEVKLVIAHAWEVLGQEFTYLFFDKNCAFRIAELLQIVNGIDITPNNTPWTLPQAIIQKLGNATRRGKPLVRKIRYHPSRQSRLYSKFNQLNDNQQLMLKHIVDDISLLDTYPFIHEPHQSKSMVLDTLLDYYQFIRIPQKKSEDLANINYRKTLATRYKLPPQKIQPRVSTPTPPHVGRDPSRIGLSVISNATQGRGALIELRPAYYDTLDAGSAHVKNAALTMAELKLVTLNNKIKIRSLNIVNIKSVNSKATGLPKDDGVSWQLNFGLQQQNLSCNSNCLLTRIQADRGYTATLNNSFFVGGYLGAAIQDNRNDYGNAYVKASSFIIAHYKDSFGIKLEAELRKHVDGSAGEELVYSVVSRYKLKKNWDLRVSYHYNKSEEFSLTLGYYW